MLVRRLRRPRIDLATALLVATTCGACASTPQTSKAPSTAATIYASAYCERLDRCQRRAVRDTFGDARTCAGRLLPDVDDELASDGVVVTEAEVQACAEQMRDAPCDVLTSSLRACQFTGSLDDGAPCGSGYQCKSGSCFRTTLCGTCSPRVPEGADCTNANCEGGLVCAGGRCRALAGVGTACDDETQPCPPDLQCVDGTCQAPLGVGEACTLPSNGAAEPLACDPAQVLSCVPDPEDPTRGRCAPVRHAQLGEACGLDAETGEQVACAGASCIGGTCVADLQEGEECGTTDAACEVPLACVDGRCAHVSIGTCADSAP